ncbi:MAG TPA: 1-deoxy-D-xylulose-5-phosphate synthase N-terminal domain-containing protein [Chlorobiota bacterium]|nr:1-deoxy-D-xylulose-5-phosphate synthase N-terminal domain-containing protein [Chlorobiota bacterium]
MTQNNTVADSFTDSRTNVALRVREHILRMSTNGGAFTGASLSCADIIVWLYTSFLRIRPESVNDAERDILLLSKGHDVPALYATFVECGFLDKGRLSHHLSAKDHIYWHPNQNISGVEFHSGSLGHLLSVGIGMAIDKKLRSLPGRVVVILGDGELNEGSIWEAFLTASALGIDNLIVIVDRNWFQANVRTEDLIPLEPLTTKFEAFGWTAHVVDGHDFDDMDNVLGSWRLIERTPQVFIANTIRGFGVPSIANRADRWFCNFSDSEVEDLIQELHGLSLATLTSDTLSVR